MKLSKIALLSAIGISIIASGLAFARPQYASTTYYYSGPDRTTVVGSSYRGCTIATSTGLKTAYSRVEIDYSDYCYNA